MSLQATDADRNSVVTYTFSDPAVYTYVRPLGPFFALKNINTAIITYMIKLMKMRSLQAYATSKCAYMYVFFAHDTIK